MYICLVILFDSFKTLHVSFSRPCDWKANRGFGSFTAASNRGRNQPSVGSAKLLLLCNVALPSSPLAGAVVGEFLWRDLCQIHDAFLRMRLSRRVTLGKFRVSREACGSPPADLLSDLFSNENYNDMGDSSGKQVANLGHTV